MQIVTKSEVGRKRKTNQDYTNYYKNKTEQILFILCDGLGGHQAGDVASRLATEYIGEQFEKEENFNLDTIQAWLDKVIKDANDYIYEKSQEDKDLEGMGTTLVLAIVLGDVLLINHVGDSRAYTYKNNELAQVTQDHSFVNELVKSGEITKDEARLHPRRNVITQSIGTSNPVEPEATLINLEDVEGFMLCSDGLTDMLPDEELNQMFNEEDDIEKLATRLVESANEAGGLDNITILLVFFEDENSSDDKGGDN